MITNEELIELRKLRSVVVGDTAIMNKRDEEFFCAAVNLMPRLLAELAAAKDEIARLKAEREKLVAFDESAHAWGE